MTSEHPEIPPEDEPPELDPGEDGPPVAGPELDPAGAGDDELQNEPVHVDTMVPPPPEGVG
jgi:hypothetical protein